MRSVAVMNVLELTLTLIRIADNILPLVIKSRYTYFNYTIIVENCLCTLFGSCQ